jgi:hypothetical protein
VIIHPNFESALMFVSTVACVKVPAAGKTTTPLVVAMLCPRLIVEIVLYFALARLS